MRTRLLIGAALDDRPTRIRSLNDRLRVTSRGGMILMTDGIAALGREAVERVFDAVRRFDRFDEGNREIGVPMQPQLPMSAVGEQFLLGGIVLGLGYGGSPMASSISRL